MRKRNSYSEFDEIRSFARFSEEQEISKATRPIKVKGAVISETTKVVNTTAKAISKTALAAAKIKAMDENANVETIQSLQTKLLEQLGTIVESIDQTLESVSV